MSILSSSRNCPKLIVVVALLLAANVARAQTTTFTYQGRLTDNGTVANGNYDFQFALFDASGGGSQIGSPLTRTSVAVANGVFTVQLDFGAGAFPGANRFLEIGVRITGGGSFTTLSPRQQITAASYGIRTLSAASADTATNATQLGGVAASQYVLSSDARLSDPRAPTAGSSNYVQNTTSQQAGSNFNIDGNGTAGGTLSGNIVRATTQYNIGGNRVLSIPGSNNVFAGTNAGSNNTTGALDSFFGASAGAANTSGGANAFFGYHAGLANVSGTGNSFFGAGAGAANTVNNNSFFGNQAGLSNVGGINNAFFGSFAGAANTSGFNNSLFGSSAGENNVTGSSNSFFGDFAGASNVTGGNNAFFGFNAGLSNTVSDNSFFGSEAGLLNTVGNSNSFFGRAAGMLNTAGNRNAFFGALAGSHNNTGALNSFFGYQAGLSNTSGGSNSFFGLDAGSSNTTGNQNSFFGFSAGSANVAGIENAFFGSFAGQRNTSGFNNSFFGAGAGLANTVAPNNSFFGHQAGFSNVAGENNAFFGSNAGLLNTASNNNFFGASAGELNTTGVGNAFFGHNAGSKNSTSCCNSFFGDSAGSATTMGGNNSFFGASAGSPNTTGGGNSFFGTAAGSSNTTESNNTFIGADSTGAAGITNATAIGRRAQVTQSNSLVLGSISGVNLATADTNVGIGTTAPAAKLDIKGSSATDIALQISGGGIKVAGAGLGTSTPVFIHRATVGNITLNSTSIDHPLTNGDPNAILIVTPNWNPGGAGGTYNNHPIGVYYNSGSARWLIFNQDVVAMPVNAAFNVLVVKP